MAFNFLSKWQNRTDWQRNLTEVMAKLAVDYNSYYQRIYEFSELLLKKPVQLLVSTQFVEGRVRFKQGTNLPILVWEIELETLLKMDFKHVEVFRSEFDKNASKVRILIPEPLAEHFKEIIETFKKFENTEEGRRTIQLYKDSGIITSSGRTFWVGWQNNTKLKKPLCFKIDTLEMLIAREYINYRRLSADDAKLSIFINDLLEKTFLEKTNLRNFLNENIGVHLQSNKTDHIHRYVTLERHIDFEKSNVKKGDFLIGMQVVLSPDFWQTKNSQKILGITSPNLGEFFTENLVAGFADLIKNSVENTFVHFEIHQQNLTCHLRNGKLQKILVHDLQDVIFDPVCFLFTYKPDQWAEKLMQISKLYKVRFFNFYGEQRLNIQKHTHYFVPASFYRRYFRNFGNYTRIFNQASGEDYLLSRKLESLVAEQLNYSDEDLGLTGAEGEKIKSSPNFSYLRQHLFWVIARRVHMKQRQLMAEVLKNCKNPEVLIQSEWPSLLLRAQREVCFFSANLPERMSLPQCEIKQVYKIFEDKIYLLQLGHGQLGALIFIPTIGIS